MIGPGRISFLLFVLLGLGVPAWGDGGLVRLDEEAGGYRVVALTSPTPLFEGDLDLTVLVRDAVDSTVIDDARIEVAILPADGGAPPGDGWISLSEGRVAHPGGAGAVFQVWPGDLVVHIRINGRAGVATVNFPMSVAEAWRFHDAWPWLLPLPVGLGIWMLREWSRRHS